MTSKEIIAHRSSSSAETHVAHTEGVPSDPFRPSLNRASASPDLEKFPSFTFRSGDGSRENPFVIEWRKPYDPESPYDWSSTTKTFLLVQLSLSTFIISMCSSIYSAANEYIAREFRISEEVALLGISLYVLGFAIGPLFWSPFSEVYGRRFVFFTSWIPFLLFQVGGAKAQNAATVIITRFFAGLFGAAPLTNSGGMISDMFTPKQRAIPATLYGLAPLLGPSIGPIIGGFVSQSHLGWRWTFWITLILAGFSLFLAFLYFPESYSPILMQRRARMLHRESKGLVFFVDAYRKGRTVSLQEELAKSLTRPFVYLFTEPIVLALSIYSAVFFAILYAYFAGFPIVFQEGHHFSPGQTGLAFLGVGIGVIIGGGFCIPVQNALYLRHGRLHPSPTGQPLPEARMQLAQVAGILMPIGVFWFAWTSYPSVHWIVPILSGLLFGSSLAILVIAIIGYLIDTYSILCASALASTMFSRYLGAAAFPLFTRPMFNSLKPHWGITIFAFLSLLCAPFPMVFSRYGPQLRARSKHASAAAKMMAAMAAAASKTPPKSSQQIHAAAAPAEESRE